MLNEDILDQALVKKNKEIDLLNERNERMKQEFNVQKRNLSNKINSLQKKMNQIQEETKNEKRVQIINKLREERKDQEQTILLLRKYILNLVDQENKEEEELKINKYLIQYRKEKFGEQRYISYEELKIKYKNNESRIRNLEESKNEEIRILETKLKEFEDNYINNVNSNMNNSVLSNQSKISQLTLI